MPIPVENLRDMKRVHVWFGLSSLAMLLSILWMIKVDYDRPWREYQDNYMATQAAISRLNWLGTQVESNLNVVKNAASRVEEARQELEQVQSQITEVKDSIAQVTVEVRKAKLPHDDAAAVYEADKDKYEKLLRRLGPQDERTISMKEDLDARAERLETLVVEKEKGEDHLRELNRKLSELLEPLTRAERQLAAAQKTADDLKAKERAFKGEVFSVNMLKDVSAKQIVNLPLLDFAAPKGTPSRHEIKQVVLPDVRQRLNYLESYTTDRCMTCHVAIDNNEFAPKELASTIEKTLPIINDIRRQNGEVPLELPEPPADTDGEGKKLKVGAVSERWENLTDMQQHEYMHQLLREVNDYLRSTGATEIHFGKPLLAHPRLDLFVSVDSAHPMAKMGCTVCHEGNPQETDFVTAAHMPINHDVEHEWKDKYYVTSMGVPNTTFETMEHYWDRMMHPASYTEAGCAKCHSEIADIGTFRGRPEATKLNFGRQLFTSVGCANCHNVEGLEDARKVGPDLQHVGHKLETDFIQSWMYAPKEFRSSTWMPHFFHQENNRDESATEFDSEPELRTETEVIAITKYLTSLTKPWTPLPIPEGMAGDAERGNELFRSVGCLACHANIAEYGSEWIPADIAHRENRPMDKAKAKYEAMTLNEQSVYGMEHFSSDSDTYFRPDEIEYDSEKEYNSPIYTRFAPDLSAIGSKVSEEWLFSWLKEPRHFNSTTKMPSLRLTDQEALDLAVYLKTLKHDTFVAESFPEDEPHEKMAEDLVFELLSGQRSAARSRAIMDNEGHELTELIVAPLAKSWPEDELRSMLSGMNAKEQRWLFLGSKMITHYGCYSCHLIPGFEVATPPGTDLSVWAEKPIAQLDFAFFDTAFHDIVEENADIYGHVYPGGMEDQLASYGSENTHQHISHTHASFAWHKMRNPRIWDREKLKKPYDKLKMPNFYFTDEQADALTTFLLSRRPARVNENLMIDYESTVAGPIAQGRLLTREFNCVGCHETENNVAQVHQYFRKKVAGTVMFDVENAPPSLRGEGAKVQPNWFFGFLHNVEMLRPWLQIRMPSFDLTDEQASALVEYFAADSQDEAGDVRQDLTPVIEYLKKAHGGSNAAGSVVGDDDLSEAEKNWFYQRLLKPVAKNLTRWALDRNLVTVWDVDPDEVDAEDLPEGYQKVLTRATFIKNLLDVDFPFTESPRPIVSQERFQLGEELFHTHNCLQCHVLGDPEVPGSTREPTAPNLGLSYRRLRQDWVRSWVQNPAWIQPGTKMPQIFPDGASSFMDFPDRDEMEAKFGKTGGEQIDLLLDFIYNAGMLNYTSIAPGAAEAAERSATTDDVEFFEEDGDLGRQGEAFEEEAFKEEEFDEDGAEKKSGDEVEEFFEEDE
jgi:cbb3-type cytochrome oxidase cytochrome c subunit/peptidoglycan hydrolase CwlO-like protein